jgi:hypothetical protein
MEYITNVDLNGISYAIKRNKYLGLCFGAYYSYKIRKIIIIW